MLRRSPFRKSPIRRTRSPRRTVAFATPPVASDECSILQSKSKEELIEIIKILRDKVIESKHSVADNDMMIVHLVSILAYIFSVYMITDNVKSVSAGTATFSAGTVLSSFHPTVFIHLMNRFPYNIHDAVWKVGAAFDNELKCNDFNIVTGVLRKDLQIAKDILDCILYLVYQQIDTHPSVVLTDAKDREIVKSIYGVAYNIQKLQLEEYMGKMYLTGVTGYDIKDDADKILKYNEDSIDKNFCGDLVKLTEYQNLRNTIKNFKEMYTKLYGQLEKYYEYYVPVKYGLKEFKTIYRSEDELIVGTIEPVLRDTTLSTMEEKIIKDSSMDKRQKVEHLIKLRTKAGYDKTKIYKMFEKDLSKLYPNFNAEKITEDVKSFKTDASPSHISISMTTYPFTLKAVSGDVLKPYDISKVDACIKALEDGFVLFGVDNRLDMNQISKNAKEFINGHAKEIMKFNKQLLTEVLYNKKNISTFKDLISPENLVEHTKKIF